MLLEIHPKLPMRNKSITKDFYVNKLGFEAIGDYANYLLLRKDKIEVHFFLYEDLAVLEHDGMCYIRTDSIKDWYQLAVDRRLDIPELGHLREQPWGQKEFSLRDPDSNLLTFGEAN
jgi:catechol 2,3-dioxygenase-like lactoylglutathione lyase family enzyme